MKYTAVRFVLQEPEEHKDALLAVLEDLPFETFEDSEDGWIGYIPTHAYDENLLRVVLGESWHGDEVRISSEEMPDQNWNKEWEKNFQPVLIAGKCYVRASFHPERNDVPITILIDPKMSFGTGHHQTTAMMVERMFSINFSGTTVLDMGSGTGVLAILAEKLGAARAVAIDFDEWCALNANENVLGNNCRAVEVRHGDASALLPEDQFDTIIANINKNVLLRDIPAYLEHLRGGGILLLSGFYETDAEDLISLCAQSGLRYTDRLVNNAWCMLAFVKE